MTNRPATPAVLISFTAMLLIAFPVFAENEPAATAPVPPAPPPAAGGPVTPAQKEAPAATAPAAKPSIVMPAETTPSKPAPEKEAAPREATAPAPAGNVKPDRENAPVNKPAVSAEENKSKPPEKTAARPKRPVHRPSLTKREREPGSNEPQTSPSYGADQHYERDYTETWRESEGPSYRAPPYYAPAPYGREEREMWREAPPPYRYGPQPFYRAVPPGFVPYPGPPLPRWGW